MHIYVMEKDTAQGRKFYVDSQYWVWSVIAANSQIQEHDVATCIAQVVKKEGTTDACVHFPFSVL